MRRIRVMVPAGDADDVFGRLADISTVNAVAVRGHDPDGEWDVVTVQVTNEAVDDVIAAVGDMEDVKVTLDTTGAIALASDSYQRPRPALDVTPRSAIEVFLSRTLGESTTVALLGYAAVAGAVVWIGLYEETGYLLVAAALAPPAGVAGMAAAIARWDLAAVALFVVGAQLVGINLVAAVVFRLHGLSPSRPSFTVGRSGVFPVAAAVSLIAFVVLALVAVAAPMTQRDRLVNVATIGIEQALEEADVARLVDADIRFSPYRTDPDRFVATLHVETRTGVAHDVAAEHVEDTAHQVLKRIQPRARTVVDVVVLTGR